jgi:hypothetical protein
MESAECKMRDPEAQPEIRNPTLLRQGFGGQGAETRTGKLPVAKAEIRNPKAEGELTIQPGRVKDSQG